MTLFVDDLDDLLAALTERGIETEAGHELPGVVRRAWVVDPDQNRIQLAEPARPG